MDLIDRLGTDDKCWDYLDAVLDIRRGRVPALRM